jgi:cytochrome P450
MQIDVYNPDNYTRGIPHEQFAWLRENAPVYWHGHPDGGGYWVLSKHADVMAVSRDFRTFSAERGFVMVDDLPPDILDMARGQLLGMDPPKHAPLRRAVITRFTSRMLDKLEPRVRDIARKIMLDARDAGEVNFVESLAGDLPTAVIGSLLEIPADMWPQIRQWSDLQTSASDPDLGGTPSLLINQEVDGQLVSEMEFASLFIQITVAGNETTRGLISSGMHELIRRPELYHQLESSPDQLPLAIEEMLRWTCPLHYFRRTATRDTEIRGQAIAEGERVVMLYSSANFDEEVFDQPMLCLGANLARLEARVFFEEFFRHFSGIEETGEPEFIRSNSIHGFKQMPVRLLPM